MGSGACGSSMVLSAEIAILATNKHTRAPTITILPISAPTQCLVLTSFSRFPIPNYRIPPLPPTQPCLLTNSRTIPLLVVRDTLCLLLSLRVFPPRLRYYVEPPSDHAYYRCRAQPSPHGSPTKPGVSHSQSNGRTATD